MVDVAGGRAPGTQVSEHMCAFYNGSDALLDIVADYLSAGLRAGNKCFCMIDTPSSVRSRIPGDLALHRADMLHILTEDEGYMPDGNFSKDTFIRTMESMVTEAIGQGYERFRAVGDESFIVRNGVDINEWFAAEAELNRIVPEHPHFFFCLYDLELFDGDTVMHVLRTHPTVYVNGTIITNPSYIREEQPTG